jgi:hypothetical protein
LEGVVSRIFVALALAVALMFVGFDRAQAGCPCPRPHRIHRLTPRPIRPEIPHPDHCCDRAESEALAELRKIREELANIRGTIDQTGLELKTAIEVNTAEVKASGTRVTEAINTSGDALKRAIELNTAEVKNTGEHVTLAINTSTETLKGRIDANTTEVKAAVQGVTAAVQTSGETLKTRIDANTEEVKKVAKAVDDAGAKVVVAIDENTKEVKDTRATLKETIEGTGKNITVAIYQAGEALKKEVQAARSVLDALYSRPNSFSVKVGNEAVPCPFATSGGTGCPTPY